VCCVIHHIYHKRVTLYRFFVCIIIEVEMVNHSKPLNRFPAKVDWTRNMQDKECLRRKAESRNTPKIRWRLSKNLNKGQKFAVEFQTCGLHNFIVVFFASQWTLDKFIICISFVTIFFKTRNVLLLSRYTRVLTFYPTKMKESVLVNGPSVVGVWSVSRHEINLGPLQWRNWTLQII
jgi:hypothetical protein